ncbi:MULTISPECIES: cyclophilin-like fold protein [unclassified Bacillus (in: firmicutes)]|uniref:cyclophilin-like fold protein n=1 Tax=unclassified Bacillus (in: firmicutes) TaxID=185979 RepID=UPI002035F590|nr:MULTISPECIES: cyclophilin-like fold protein [unclassified Bacillus (in: firmicutes)]
MKKIITLFLSFLAVMLLISCTNMQRNTTTTETEVDLNETSRTSSPVSEKKNLKKQKEGVKEMKIKLTVGQDEYTASLNDSKTASDFIDLLPMTLTLEDYAGTEKISDLPKRLSTTGSPEGTAASIGDITYYAPWGNLAIFYRDFGFAKGLIKLGRIESGTEKLANNHGDFKVKIERID